MPVSFFLFSGLTSVFTVPAGNFSNASLVGAKTVKGPLPSNVVTRSAAFTAATKVVWSFEFIAFWTMFLLAYIGAPPTVGFWAANTAVAPATATSAAIIMFLLVIG